MRFALLLFIVMPIIEMWSLIIIGSYIGALSTIALVLFTALIGIGLLREQGYQPYGVEKKSYSRGEYRLKK